jgi:putative flippase GtrA
MVRNLCRALFSPSIVRYTILSGFAAIFELSVLYLLASVLHLHYLASVAIAYILANALQFLLVKHYCFFDPSSDYRHQVLRFIAINLGGLIFTMLLVFVFVEYLGIWYLAARALALCIVLFYSHTMHKSITFRRESP